MIDLIGCNIKIGKSAVVNIYKARVPCKRMDEIYKGLQKITKNEKLGVIAEIVVSGEISVGDKIVIVKN